MGERSEEELDALIREHMPGWQLSRRSRQSSADIGGADETDSILQELAEASTPSITDLREKYLGAADSGEDSLMLSDEPEAEIVTAEPVLGDEEDRHTKAVVISSEGKILGAQG